MMNMNSKKNLSMSKKMFMFAGLTALLFVVMIILLKTTDVQAIGPENSEVGFATVNGFMAEVFPYNEAILNVTEVLGYTAIALAGVFAVTGVVQLVMKKNFWQIDSSFVPLAALYVLTVFSYVLFEVITINYRPVILDPAEGLEVSFPSSHTLLSCVILSSAIVEIGILIKNKTLRLVLQILALIMMCAIVFGRMASGVHWFTDILGGIVLSSVLIFLYLGFLRVYHKIAVSKRK